jgi:hypothetical protein
VLEAELEKSLETGDYPRAIALCLECRNAFNTYKHFSAVNDMSINLPASV